MNKKLQVIVKTSEIFGKIRFAIIDNKEYAVGKDIAEALGYSDPSSAISKHCKHKIKSMIEAPCQDGNMVKTQTTFIPEGDIYRLIIKSKLPKAQEFESWIMDEVLPQIRQTGGYIPISENDTDEDLLARAVLVAQRTIEKKNQIIANQQKEIENKNNELDHKEDVIIGLVKDITLAEKRQRITQIVRHNHNNYTERYGLLYKELEKKYHLNIQRRMENAIEKGEIKKSTRKMEYICNVMNMTNELYEICCKLFENDFNSLVDEFKNGIA